jgi:aminoglycoside N3'-acetyltransferase
VAADLQKLVSEYRAMEKVDRILEKADLLGKTDLIGVRARIIRPREILRELSTWIRASQHSKRDAHSEFMRRSDS